MCHFTMIIYLPCQHSYPGRRDCHKGNCKDPPTETNYVWGKCQDGCRDPGLESKWECDEVGQCWIHKNSRKTVEEWNDRGNMDIARWVG
jgi:hypothetical protein